MQSSEWLRFLHKLRARAPDYALTRITGTLETIAQLKRLLAYVLDTTWKVSNKRAWHTGCII
jgi:hypothetical protein